LETVNFIKPIAKNVDLRSSFIVDSVLVDGPNQEILLPDNPKNFVAFPKAFQMVYEELKTGLTTNSRKELDEIVDFVSDSIYGEVVDESFFKNIDKPARELVLKKLYEYRAFK